MAVFPSRRVHVGCDEVLKGQWRLCPACQRRMRELGLKDEAQLQVGAPRVCACVRVCVHVCARVCGCG